jgi:hypothetical protein
MVWPPEVELNLSSEGRAFSGEKHVIYFVNYPFRLSRRGYRRLQQMSTFFLNFTSIFCVFFVTLDTPIIFGKTG